MVDGLNYAMFVSVSSRDRTQRSGRIRLRAGRVYFVEVVMKEGGGGDHVSVGVKIPRSRRIRPVSRKNIFVRPPSKGKFFSCTHVKSCDILWGSVDRNYGANSFL